MQKIKITLDSGSVIEKSLLTAFKDTEKTYVILDNEMNGSMGLPIILVTTLNENRLEKIPDKSQEWEDAKNYLRAIINSETMNYVAIPNDLQASEVFFTQLTLPVASFDALKENYKVSEEITNEQGNIAIEEPAKEEVAVNNNEVTIPDVPVADPMVGTVVGDTTPASVEPAPVEPVMPAAPAVEQTEAIVKEIIEKPVEDKRVDLTQEKEAFMKACENMFDALVAKFNK